MCDFSLDLYFWIYERLLILFRVGTKERSSLGEAERRLPGGNLKSCRQREHWKPFDSSEPPEISSPDYEINVENIRWKVKLAGGLAVVNFRISDV
jgi:hypothetical protein